MNIQGSVEWQTIIGACVTVSTSLLGFMFGLMADYMDDRRNRNSWENILKEIDVFNRWIDEGHMETIDRLYSHIEESINERFRKRQTIVYWFPMGAVAILDIWYIKAAFSNHQWPISIISLLSLLCIVAFSIYNIREDAKRKANRKIALRTYMKKNIEEMASLISDVQTEEEKLVRLERNDDIDARWVTHLSRGSAYRRRLLSEYWHVVREKADDMEVERLVNQVLQLPDEPSIDEE